MALAIKRRGYHPDIQDMQEERSASHQRFVGGKESSCRLQEYISKAPRGGDENR